MSHRAQQIVDAIATELGANASLAAVVFTNRILSLSEPDQELPAVSVLYGADVPADADGASNLAFLDSFIQISTIAIVREIDEAAVLTKLLELRRQIHITLMAGDRTQGLAFIIDTRYAGASAPELDGQGAQIAGRLAVNWTVFYRMNINDPA
jgi:hypothetical protein